MAGAATGAGREGPDGYAALLVFAIAPLQRMAQRLADRAMPGVKAPQELTPRDRARIYRDAASAAWADGAVDAKERLVLERLRLSLGLSGDEALAIEGRLAEGVA